MECRGRGMIGGMNSEGMPWAELEGQEVVALMDDDPVDGCAYVAAYDVNPCQPLAQRRRFVRGGGRFIEVDPSAAP